MTAKQPPNNYTGSVYVGAVGSEIEYGPAHDSIEAMARRFGDSTITFVRATKGYEARQHLINKFLETNHDFIMLLDSDMSFPRDALERLRSHGLPYVSGFYMRRNAEALAPVWYRPYTGVFPLEPWVGEVPQGTLHKIGASGWGCMLVHRAVILGVRELLKGELEVLEDDMDIYPYDLERIMQAINWMQKHIDGDLMSPIAFQNYVNILKEEIRPFRCDREIVGSDIRFPVFAHMAGFQLYGDPAVSCGHVVNYPLKLADYNAVPRERVAQVKKAQRREIIKQRKRLKAQKDEVMNA